jgi:hypothetical protein
MNNEDIMKPPIENTEEITELGAINLDNILDNIDLTSTDLEETRRPVLKVETNFNRGIIHKEKIH